MGENSSYGGMSYITIEVLKGGFVLQYPVLQAGRVEVAREVFASPRKLNQKLKEVLDVLSFVPVEKADAE